MSEVRVVLPNENVSYATAYRMPIKPSDEERAALQQLAEAVQSAAGGGE